MANLTEPFGGITETITTGTAVAAYELDYSEGYVLDNVTMTGGAVTLTDSGEDGVLYTPVFTIPKLASYTSVIVTKDAGDTPIAWIKTDYEDEWRLIGDTANLSINGNTVYIKVVFTAGAASSLTQVALNYSIAWAAPTDLDQFSYIDEENTLSSVFSDSMKRNAINYAHSRIIFRLQDAYNTHYKEHLTIPSLDLLKQAECYYALGDLYGTKSDQLLNMIDSKESFSVGGVSIQPADTKRKDIYLHYLRLSDRFTSKANEIFAMVVPPGVFDTKTPFAVIKGNYISDDYT
ncbi:MAG: hypothetical protein KAU20_06480 [Nanoarchaeota archaeon]|nr:hypothetical protein [Nanoarchaeota archaeon]